MAYEGCRRAVHLGGKGALLLWGFTSIVEWDRQGAVYTGAGQITEKIHLFSAFSGLNMKTLLLPAGLGRDWNGNVSVIRREAGQCILCGTNTVISP